MSGGGSYGNGLSGGIVNIAYATATAGREVVYIFDIVIQSLNL